MTRKVTHIRPRLHVKYFNYFSNFKIISVFYSIHSAGCWWLLLEPEYKFCI